MITIHVLGYSDLYFTLLNAMATFMSQSGFMSLLRITALIGIIMATMGFLKKRDPMIYGNWMLAYVLIFQVAILPKTSVSIVDISNQGAKDVDNVPVVFAVTMSFITTIGVSLAENFDMLLSEPDDLTYTKTGSLFGSRIIQASRNFHIINPQLKNDVNAYLRNCVIGDIRLNRKYSMDDLSNSGNIWSLISKKPSPIRMTEVNGDFMSCVLATPLLKAKLDSEIKTAYTFFGIQLFDHPISNYDILFDTHLKSAFKYFKNMSDTSADIFLQSMMINAIGDGIKDYQTFTDSTAGVVNNLVSKSEVQHRWSWAIAGQKAAWFLPILYSVLSLLLFGIFPIILIMTTLPNGLRIIQGYLQFFISLQFWPLLFAILNMVMTVYGSYQSSKYNAITLVNIDKIDELHADLAGVAGYLMLMIPFIAKGLVSNFSDSFNNLATSMSSHLQGSAMSVANDAASASFSLGQTSFYNASANNLSANKHDTNWTNMHGMHTEQFATGVTKTRTGNGNTVFDVSPGMTKSAVSINAQDGLSASLNQAYEQSTQAARNESTHYQNSLSNFAHRALQLSQLSGHDMRLGDGVSESETGQYSKALSIINHIAEDMATKTGMSKDDALTHLTSGGWGATVGIKSQKSIFGKLVEWSTGLHAGIDAHTKFERSSSSSDRYHEGVDSSLSERQSHDFNEALNFVNHFAKNHHFDESHSKAASLSNQLGADLREAETASHNVDASLNKAERISRAKNYVQSHSTQISKNLDQAFPSYVANKIGESARDELYSHPENAQSINKLQSLGQDFIEHKRDELIAEFGSQGKAGKIESFYDSENTKLANKEHQLASQFHQNSDHLNQESNQIDIEFDTNQVRQFQQKVSNEIDKTQIKTKDGKDDMLYRQEALSSHMNHLIAEGQVAAQKNLFVPENIHLPFESKKLHTKGE